MKRVLLIMLFTFSSMFCLGLDKIYNQFSGFEDSNKNIHLLYSKYLFGVSNDLYYLNVSTNEETLIQSGTWEGSEDKAYWIGTTSSRILDYNVTSNKSSYLFIYKNLADSLVEIRTQIEDSTFHYFSSSYSFRNIFTTVDKDILYVSYQNWDDNSYGLFKSIDMGRNWNIVFYPNTNIYPIAISPYDSSLIFGVNSEEYLMKSEDGGLTFSIVEDENTWYSYSTIKFDIDRETIYAQNRRSLLTSISKGDSSTWRIIFELPVVTWGNALWFLEVDKVNSGTLYFAGSNNYVWKSNNFGINYSLYAETLKAKFYGGLYLASSSNKLFVANKNIINVITEKSNDLLSAINQDNSISLYPLSVGNKWILKGYKSWDGVNSAKVDATVEIVSDTLMQNNKKYFQIERVGFSPFLSGFERVDTLGFIYRYDTTYTDNEYIIGDLSLFSYAIDTLDIENTNHQLFCNGIVEREYFSETYVTKVFTNSRFPESYEYDYSKTLGLTSIRDNWDFGYSEIILVGAIIDGVLYGDTTTVGINDTELDFSYSLEQNYPNPFNPTTKISYTILSEGFVTIKLYDIIGNMVRTLVEENKRSGKYEINFNGKNLTSGVYFYRIIVNEFSDTRKMILLK